MGFNNLVGSIPNETGRLQSLYFFAAPVNCLSGMIPSFYNLSSIDTISIAGNRLNRTLPFNIGFGLSNLEILAIGGNQFFGPILVLLSNTSSLKMVEIAMNNFVGPVPQDLGKLHDLWWLNLGGNYLGSNSSNDDLGFLTSLTNCSKLEKLGLHSSNHGGVLPDSIGNLSTKLNSLFLGGNHMHGNLPASLGNLVNLNVLHMEIKQPFYRSNSKKLRKVAQVREIDIA